MKTTAAILILIVNLWSLMSDTPLHSLFDTATTTEGRVTTMQDPPDDSNNIIIPPPR
jgi:hypothetical protein